MSFVKTVKLYSLTSRSFASWTGSCYNSVKKPIRITCNSNNHWTKQDSSCRRIHFQCTNQLKTTYKYVQFLPKSELVTLYQHQYHKPKKLFNSNNITDVQMYCKRFFSTSNTNLDKKGVSVTFIMPDGERVTATGKEGDSLYDLVIDNDIDIDGFGACEATLACSTCHLILSKEDYDRLAESPSDEELDMLDLAYGLTDTSRLGCQITLTPQLDGLVVRVPSDRTDNRDV